MSVRSENFQALFAQSVKSKGILLFGPPGSGKGTLGKALATVSSHYHFSSGDMFRGIDPLSALGVYINSITSQGHLISDEETVQIASHYLQSLMGTYRFYPGKQKLLLDGIPRTPSQVSLIEPIIEVEGIILLECADTDALIKRMQKRAQEEGRKDDADPEVLARRHEIYHKETEAVLTCYPGEKIIRINAQNSRLQVLNEVLERASHLLED